jgi:ankyrin repeat protein
MLIDGGAALNVTNRPGCTPLHRACDRGREYIVRMLIDGGADLDVADRDGWTPLHQACRLVNIPTTTKGHAASLEIIRTLILNGADTQARDNQGRLPVEFLRAEGHQRRALYEEAVAEMDSRALRPVLK